MWGKIIIVFIILGVLAGAGYYFLSRQNSTTTGEETAAETSVTPEPSATPTPEPPARDTYTIQILNGGGQAGAATAAKQLLEDAGYTVDSTGNTEEYTYTETVIQAGDTVESSWLDDLRSVLSGTYDVKSDAESISGTTDSDVVVIIGSPDAGVTETPAATEETETPTPEEETPTPSPTASP